MSSIRRFWPVLAVIAGAALIFFELRRSRGVTGDNAIWLLVGGLVFVLGAVDFFSRGGPKTANGRK